MSDPNDLQERFPKMRPIKSNPFLFTLNGCGLSVYGRRNVDQETGTYIKTHCLCLVFIPILTLGAYRVADAENGGWYFLGKERLSSFAKGWNVLLLVLAGIFSFNVYWEVHTNSPEYIAAQTFAQAQEQLEKGDIAGAAKGFKGLLREGKFHRAASLKAIREIGQQDLASSNPEHVIRAFKLNSWMAKHLKREVPLIVEPWSEGMVFVNQFMAKHPDKSIKLFDRIQSKNPEPESNAAKRVELLTQWTVVQPDAVEPAVELALFYEAQEDYEKMLSLLIPHKENLGVTEGSRMLGQVFLQEQEYDAAYDLLSPYVGEHLEKLHAAEKAYSSAADAAYNKELDYLNQGKAPQSFYTEYESATEAEQMQMVDDFIYKRMKDNQRYNRALERYQEANFIVPVVLDLGIVQLNRAQNLSDPTLRQQELEAAEKTFLGISSAAGDSDEYRLFLGQVYYWLGKYDQGRGLFDELLNKHQRAAGILLSLANTLRDIGEVNDARAMAEEAYKNAQDPEDRYSAASFRALVKTDIDDEIAWLKKADTTQNRVQISLNYAYGVKAISDGDNKQAAKYLWQVIKGYEAVPSNGSVLNNMALAYGVLYSITGDPKVQKKETELMEQALSTAPSDTILLYNTISSLLTDVEIDILKNRIQVELLEEGVDRSMLKYCYSNSEERQAMIAQLNKHPKAQKAMAYLDKLMLLSPKSVGAYSMSSNLYNLLRDSEQMQMVLSRMESAGVDASNDRESLDAMYRGDKDAEYLESSKSNIQRYQELMKKDAVRSNQATLAYIETKLCSSSQTAYMFGAKPSAQSLVKLARHALSTYPCSATRSNLSRMLMFQAYHELITEDKQFADVAAKTRRSLSASYLLPLLVDENTPFKAKILANKSYQEALRLIQKGNTALPESVTHWDWVALRHSAEDAGTALLGIAAKNDVAKYDHAIDLRLGASGAYDVLQEYWQLKAARKSEEAKSYYEQARTEWGVPLPTVFVQ